MQDYYLRMLEIKREKVAQNWQTSYQAYKNACNRREEIRRKLNAVLALRELFATRVKEHDFEGAAFTLRMLHQYPSFMHLLRMYQRRTPTVVKAKRRFQVNNLEFQVVSRKYHARRMLVEEMRVRYSRAIQQNLPHNFSGGLVLQYRSNADELHVYFGGDNRPNGPWHAHYAFDRTGALLYRRPPGIKR